MGQIILNLLFFYFGGWALVHARKLQKAQGNKAKVAAWYLFGAIVALILIGKIAITINPIETTASAPQSTKAAQNPPTRAELLRLVNAERAKHGVAPLKEDKRLDRSAQMKADDEAKTGEFGHYCSGCLSGIQEAEKSLGMPGNYSENLTENISGNNTSEQAVYSWISSKPHHDAMIDERYTLTGFGINGTEIVEHFYSQQQFTTPTTAKR